MAIKTFPTLYKKTNTNALQLWKIWVDGPTICTEFGQVDGRIQFTSDTIKEGKNEGRSNATTPETQAESEAKSKWEKQLKKGYVEDIDAARAGEVDETVITGGVNPMLAHKYRDHSAKIKFPCYAQFKLDGVRCISVIEPDGTVTQWSRTRKPITSVPHIVKELSKLAGKKRIILDGELYVNKYKNDFEKIISLVRQQNPAPGHEAIQYWVYDMVDFEDFEHRTLTVKALLGNLNPSIVVTVPTYLVKDSEKLDEYFALFLEEGYEGLMARNAKGEYQNKRSYNLQKVKEMQDAEFLIIDVESGRGKREGQAVLVLQNEAKQVFRASPKGTDEYRRKLLENAKNIVGKYATVQYQNLTALGVPRFGVAKCVRDYE
jgi:DNA ligase-1